MALGGGDRIGVAAFGVVALLFVPTSSPAAAVTAQADGCVLLVADRNVTTATSPGDAVEIDAGDTVSLVGRAPEPGLFEVELEYGPTRATVHRGSLDPRRGESFEMGGASQYGVGIYRLHVHGPAGCEWSFWVEVTGRNPLTTPVGTAAAGGLLAGLLGVIRGMSRAGQGLGGLRWAVIGAVPAGASANVLAQQFGIAPVTTSSLALWTGPPAVAGGVVQQVVQMVGRRATSTTEATAAPQPPPRPRMAEPEAAPKPPSQARFLQSQVRSPEGPVPASLQPGASYDVAVRIGPPDDEWGVSNTAAFPEEALPTSDTPVELTVVFTEATAAPTPMVDTIRLPSAGASTGCTFAVSVASDATTFDGRIVVLHRNRVLQSGVLTRRVTDDPTDEDEAPAFVPDTVVHAGLAGLDDREAFDASLVLDKADGHTQATGITSSGAQLLSLDGIEELVERIEGRLSSVTADPDAVGGLEGEEGLALLRYLAVQGSLLRDRLLEGQVADPAILAAQRLQVVALKPEAFLPLEYIYDRPPPAKDAVLCSHVADTLLTGRCHDDCVNATTVPNPVVCPLGFWALNRVIERHASDGKQVQQLQGRADYRLGTEPTADRNALVPHRGALFAWSARVDRKQPSPALDVIDALREITDGNVATAVTWQEWVDTVRTRSPGLLVLLSHTLEDEDYEQPALEISEKEQLVCAFLDEAHVRPSPHAAPPVVLLLGCETATTGLAFETFMTAFRDKGAAIVVGTLSTVLGYHAAAVAAALVRALHEAAVDNATFGDALVAARRRLLADGLLMALSLTAYGDADWRLADQPQPA